MSVCECERERDVARRLKVRANIKGSLLYVAWANQRHRQCLIRHTEQFLTELCCMTESKARVAEPSLF